MYNSLRLVDLMIRFFNQSFQWETPNLMQLAPAAQEDLKEKWILLPSIASPSKNPFHLI